MMLKEWLKILIEKDEHYPISDDFISKYQQGPTKNGYIEFALQVGKNVNRNIAEPSQKWHFFESYIMKNILDDKITLETEASVIYSGLQCPELILWLCEASGIENDIIYEASNCAKIIIDDGIDGRARNNAGKKFYH